MTMEKSITTERVCARCGYPIEDGDDVRELDGELYHVECYEELPRCACCGKVLPEDAETVTVNNSETWCLACAEDSAYQCGRCGEWYTRGYERPEDVHTGYREVETWCHSCADVHASQCYHCDEWYSADSGLIANYDVYGIGEVPLCEDCCSYHYSECERCGCMVYEDDVQRDRNDDVCCPDCNCGSLQDYCHTDADGFFSVSEDKAASENLYLGVELETEDDWREDPEELAQKVLMVARSVTARHIIDCKADGSLSDDGVEIVSQPCSPRYHTCTPLWREITNACKERGAKSHDTNTCGLHIHVSRKFFHDSGRAAYILDRLISRFGLAWLRFSRRSWDQISRWAAIDVTGAGGYPGKTAEEKVSAWASKRGWERYRAINTNNYSTIEFRMFRGTLNLTTLLAAVEAVSALCIMAKRLESYPDAVESMTWDDVKREMLASLMLYEIPSCDLSSYLSRIGL